MTRVGGRPVHLIDASFFVFRAYYSVAIEMTGEDGQPVSSEVSATDVRRRARQGQSIHGLVSARVEEYILKQGGDSGRVLQDNQRSYLRVQPSAREWTPSFK